MPGRPRKLLENSTGDLTVERKMQKVAEEELISEESRELLNEIPAELRDKLARDTWQRILPDLLKKKTTCNLDRDNMICYCNAWSQYLECCRKLKRNKRNDVYQSMWLSRQRCALAEQRRYSALLGMDVNSRLKAATIAISQEDDQIRGMFGDI